VTKKVLKAYNVFL